MQSHLSSDIAAELCAQVNKGLQLWRNVVVPSFNGRWDLLRGRRSRSSTRSNTSGRSNTGTSGSSSTRRTCGTCALGLNCGQVLEPRGGCLESVDGVSKASQSCFCKMDCHKAKAHLLRSVVRFPTP